MSTVLAPARLTTRDVGASATPNRRRFTLAYEREILRAAERCTAPGEIAALLRREGLYSSHLATWRKAEREGQLAAPARQRGPGHGPAAARADAPEVQTARAGEAAAAKRIAELARALQRATARAERAEALVEAQKRSLRLSRAMEKLIALLPNVVGGVGSTRDGADEATSRLAPELRQSDPMNGSETTKERARNHGRACKATTCRLLSCEPHRPPGAGPHRVM